MYGPLEYVLFEFDDDKFIDEILPKMIESQKQGCVGVVDLVFIMKDEAGQLITIEVDELSDEDEAQFAPLISETIGTLSVEDIEFAARQLPSNATGAVLLLEHRWAVSFSQAIHKGGGTALDSAYISPRVHAELVVEMEQMEAENA